MPIDRGIVDEQLQALGESPSWWDHRELRDLPTVLHADEHILAIARGKVARIRWLRRSWLIVVTDQRLLCLRSGGGSGWRQIELPARLIDRVSLRVGPFRARLVVAGGGATYRFLTPRPHAYRLQAALTALGASGKTSMAAIGPSHVVRRMVDHVLALPAAAFAPTLPAPAPPPPRDTTELEQRMQLLEEQVQHLQQQVDFLEDLLQRSHSLPGPGGRTHPS
jgi:hypothetical protein